MNPKSLKDLEMMGYKRIDSPLVVCGDCNTILAATNGDIEWCDCIKNGGVKSILAVEHYGKKPEDAVPACCEPRKT